MKNESAPRTKTTTIRAALAGLAVCACAPPSETQAQSSATLADSVFQAAPEAQTALPPALREISGMAASADGRIFAHDDERAIVYQLDIATGQPLRSFALGAPPEAGDFEGLAITPAGAFYMITSTGQIYSFREGGAGASVAFERFDTGLAPACEIEGLAYLAAEQSLIIACKRNQARAMRETISLYAWRPGEAAARPWRNYDGRSIAAAAGVSRFQPSSVEFDAASGRMLLLSARDGALAEFAPDGALIAARALNSSHVQAESLAITPDGGLLIGDEGGRGVAQLSRYGREP